MKLLSELGSCFSGGGSIVTPPSAAEGCSSVLRSSSRLRDDQKGGTNYGGGGSGSGSSHEVAASSSVTTVTGLRKNKATNTSRNWKPKLHVISEDTVVMMNHHDSSAAVRSDNKLSVKVKAKSKPKFPSYVSGDDYWKKSSNLWALPAFSPAPFAF